ncbi:unnamed protein product [Cunninghamella blakesleeana]
MSEPQILETLTQYQSVGNVKGAVKLVRRAQEHNKATLPMYQILLKTLMEAPLDIENTVTVTSWFYSPEFNLPNEIKGNMEIWHDVLKLGYRLGSTSRKDDLKILINTFVNTFDLDSMTDQTSWELLIRGFGITKDPTMINFYLKRLLNDPQYSHFDKSSLTFKAALAYIPSGCHKKVDDLAESLISQNQFDAYRIQLIIRAYAFTGDLKKTQKYIDICNKIHPKVNNDTMYLIAHKVALHKQYEKLVQTRGYRGLPLKPASSPELDELHQSWEHTLKNLSGKIEDVIQCNIILEYLTIANRIDSKQYPLELAEKFINEYMPGNDVKPNLLTWMLLLKGYSTTSEYENCEDNVRLDRALTVLARMQGEGYHANQTSFHSLYRACLPLIPGKGYVFDYFNSASDFKSTLKFKPKLDHRIFELEKIMLDAKIPHDRTTIKLMLTSFGVTGKYTAMWNRWNLLKMVGVKRDMGLYQHIFTLASMDPEQSQYALAVTRSELGREPNHNKIPWDTYVAILECAITAQMPDMATLIIQQMKNQYWKDNTKLNANHYSPLLKAYTAIPSLSSEVDGLLKEMSINEITYNNTIWQHLMSHHILHDNSETSNQNIQQLFNSFTMQQFEKQGRIPIPVRETSPTVPFPSGPYSAADMAIINMYIASLLDSEDVSLVFDVLKTLNDESDSIGLSRDVTKGIVDLAKQEKSNTELSWLVHNLLPKVSQQNAEYKRWLNYLQETIPK